ncbi:putative Ig domain-containing protein [Bosea sp. ANAM02]|uniref:putative Ig domain-containing protein n=1 Tax=Bosea sp. ANAM02 TaxID=2020412 RepID=UPI00140EC313|nr:putative Ig domain-containing protein [Bosea sp. ANAM02]BCB22025.1 hypothetical protein OCUBac02_49190 [Bosea sp. ANAM02]
MLRRIISAVLAVSIALPQGAFAQQAFYFRHTVSSVATPTNPGTPGEEGPVRGTGDLAIYLPVQVRARLGVPFSLQLTAQNGTGPIAWSSIGTALPAGLTFNPSTGLIAGIPSQIQSSTAARFKGVDASGKTGESPSLIIDVQPVPTVTVLPNYTAKTGEAVTINPTARPVFGSQSWSIAGQLPLGLSLNPNTGSIIGTPRQQGTYPGLRLTVTDADGATGSSAEFMISVTSTILITGLPSKVPARLARAINEVRPNASGTPGPYRWSVSEEGSPLPAGLTLNGATGVISGSATAAGKFDNVALKIVDNTTGASTISPPVSFTVGEAPSIAVSGVYNFRQGQNARLMVSPQGNNLLAGGYWTMSRTIPGYEFRYENGSLFGYVGSLASYTGVTFSVVDLFDGATATSSPTTINILKGLSVTAPSVPSARVGQPFTASAPMVDGLVGTGTWSAGGSLPAGLSIDSATGVISGTPTEVGNRETTVRVRDSHDGIQASSRLFNINVRPAEEPVPFAIADVPESLPASTNQFFRYTPTVSGAKGTVSWSVVGSLPAWLQIDAGTGALVGTPTAVGTVPGLSLRATDSSNGAQVTSNTFAISITPSSPVTVTMPETVSVRVAEETTTAAPTVTGTGSQPVYSIVSGRVPEGLAFDSQSGRFSGMPTVSGDLPGLSILVTDQAGRSGVSNNFTISVAPSNTSPTVAMSSRTATTGQEFSATPQLTNAFAPLTWKLDSGELPSWAALDTSTGAISGTPPAAGISGEISLFVTDRFGRSGRSAPFTISVVDMPVFSATMAANLAATQGSTFSASPTVVGAKGTTSWSISAGNLPAGLALTQTGSIMGLPTTVGTFSGLVLSGQDASGATTSTKPFTITVGPSPLTMDAFGEELIAHFNVPFNAPAPTVRGAQGTLAWSLAAGTLPSWATLNTSTGRISGTPNSLAETTGLRLRVTDENGTNAQTTPFKLTVNRPTLTATLSSSLSFHINSPIATPAPELAGVLGSPTFAITSGTLPAGLTLNPSNGVISGNLSSSVSATNLILTVTDSYDRAVAHTSAFSISVLGDPQITVASEYPGARDAVFAATPSVTNAIAPQTWTLASGTLPSWANLSASTGAISGRPNAIETISGISLRMTDAAGGVATSAPFSIVISSGLSAASRSSYTPRIGVAFTSEAPQVFNAKGTISWSIDSGSLPSWATLDTTTGQFSGTPAAASNHTVVLRLTDSAGGFATVTPITIDTKNSAQIAVANKSVRVGAPLTLEPTATGAVTTMTWSVNTGTLPAWALLNPSTGAITGTPEATGDWTLSLKVTEADGAVSTSPNFTVSATPGLSVANKAPSYGGRVERAFSMAPVTVNGAIGELVWSLAPQANLVPGMTLNGANGVLGGTPSNAGAFTANLIVRDKSDQATLAVPLTVQIAGKLTIVGPSTVQVHAEDTFASNAPSVSGQRGTLTWALTGANLPGWATFNAGTGTITGLAPVDLTTVGPLTLTATDSVDQEKSNELTLSLQVIGRLGVANLPTSFLARNGTAFTSARPTAVNAVGASNWTWGQGSNPPAWVSLNAATGVLTGTPNEITTTSGLTLVVSDTTGKVASSAPFTLTVYNQPTVTVSTDTVKKRVGDAISITANATGLAGTPTWSLVFQPGSDQLPAGLNFDNSTGRITGTPTAPGSSFFMIRVTDSNDQSVADSPLVSLTIGPQFSITGLGNSYFARVGSFIDLGQPTIIGQAGPTVTFSVALANGSLPQGLSLDSVSGQIRGVPSTSLSPTIVTLTATDSSDSAKATASFTLGAMPNPSIGNVGNVTLRNDTAVESNAFAPNGANLFYPNAGYWTISGNLPNGVSLNPATGRLLGTPTGYATLATFPGLTLTLTDTTDNKSTTSSAFSITVNSGLAVTTAQSTYTLRAGTSFTTQAPTAVGISGTPIWSIANVGGTPRPYSINSATGAMVVTPPAGASGNWVYALTVKDSQDNRTASTQVTASVLPATTISYTANSPITPGQSLTLNPTVRSNLGALQFSVSTGTLPAGITLDESTGQISGSTSVTGTAIVRVQARDTDGYVASSADIRIAVSNAPDVFLGDIPTAKVGKPFTLVPTTNISTVTWSLTGSLPAGLTFSAANGSITGTPTAAVTSGSLKINALNTATSITGSSDNFVLAVAQPNVISVAAAAPKWRKGLASTTQLAVANAVGGVTWSISSNALPPGVAIDSTGKISGTPTQFGTYAPVVRVVDSENAAATLTHTLDVQVGPSLTYQSAVIRPAVNSNIVPTTQNLVGAPTFSLNGTLPAGLSFNTTTGAITGVPTGAASNTPALVTVRLTDSDGAVAEAQLSLIVSENAFIVDAGGTAFTATVGQPFRLAPVAYLQNQTVGQYASWVISGRLPQGLSFDAITGVVAGTPTAFAIGASSFSIQATYNYQSASTPELTITVADRAIPTASFDANAYTVRRNAQLDIRPSSQNTIGGVMWSVISGALPPGVAVNETTGALNGVPSSNGTYQIALRVTDSSKTANTQAITITVQDGLDAAVTEVSSNNRIGKVYLANAIATGASGTVTWSLVQGPFPSGLSLNAENGYITGTPGQAGSFLVKLRATDATGASKDVSYTISVGAAPQIASISALSAVAGKPFSFTPTVTNAVPSLVWEVIGTLPAGLTFNNSTGAISGTPTTVGTGSELRLLVRDGDGLTATSRSFLIAVTADSTSFSAAMPSIVYTKQGAPLSIAPTLTGATGASQSYTLQYLSGTSWYNATAGVLPTGLTFSSTTGAISGSPTNASVQAAYRIVVVDNRSPSAVTATTNQFTMVVEAAEPFKISTASKFDIQRGQAFQMAPTVTGNVGATTYSLYYAQSGSFYSATAAHLPAGITFNPANGTISGTTSVQSVPATTFSIYGSDSRSVGTMSNQFTLSIQNWESGKIVLPSNITVNRGQPVEIIPTLQGVTGTVSSWYLYGLSGTSSTNIGSGSVVPGMTWSNVTGAFGGTPTSTTPYYQSYRLYATENRNGQSLPLYSNQMVITIADWAKPAASIDQTVQIRRGVPATITPTITGVVGTLSVQLQGYNGSNYTTASLPQGLAMNPSTGVISGTPLNTSTPNFLYRYIFTETRNGVAQSFYSNAFSIAIANWDMPVVAYPERTDFVIGQPLTLDPEVSNIEGTPTYRLAWFNGSSWSYSASGPAYLPNGLTFDGATGRISGTPTAATYGQGIYQVTLTEVRPVSGQTQNNVVLSRNFRLAGAAASSAPKLAYGTNNTIIATANDPLDVTPVLSGATAVTGPYTLTYGPVPALTGGKEFYTGSLPSGVGFDTTTGRFTSARILQTAGGNWHGYKICAPTAAGQACAEEVTFRIADRPLVSVEMSPYIDGTRRQSLSVTPTVKNAVGAVTWQLFTQQTSPNGASNDDQMLNTLPAGLSFDTSTGTISGTPTVIGNFRGYKIAANDSQGATYRGMTQEIIIRIAEMEPFVLKAPTLLELTVGDSVDVRPTFSGNFGSVTWDSTISTTANYTQTDGVGTIKQTALPTGLSYSGGALSGTLTAQAAEGNYRGYRICATDGANRGACTDEILIRVLQRPALTVKVPTYVTAKVGDAVSLVPSVENGFGTITWNSGISAGTAPVVDGQTGDFNKGTLPGGLVYSPTDGSITGTLQVNLSPGRYRGYKVGAKDVRNVLTFSDEIIIEVLAADAARIQVASVTDAVRGQPVTIKATATTPLGPFTFGASLNAGSTTAQDGANGDFVKGFLPSGLAYDPATGTVSGTVAVGVTPGRYRGYKFNGTDRRGQTVMSEEFIINVQ